jgi:TonB family protein
MRITKRAILTIITGSAALLLAGCPQKTPVAVTPPPPAVQGAAPNDGYVQVSQRDAAKRRIDSSFPLYPDSARQAHEQGTVVFSAIIGKDGHVFSLKLMKSSYRDLAEAAAASIHDWIYDPYLVNGAPVEFETTITINFTMG